MKYQSHFIFFFFFFNDTATTEIYTLSLHDALPICLPALLACKAHRKRSPALHRPWLRLAAIQNPHITSGTEILGRQRKRAAYPHLGCILGSGCRFPSVPPLEFLGTGVRSSSHSPLRPKADNQVDRCS